MYIYGIYPTGNSDIIPLALTSNVVLSHVYISDEPIKRLSTRMEFKIPYVQALTVLSEVSAEVHELLQSKPSDYVYFAVAINPRYDQSKEVTERTIVLNGRSLSVRNIALGALVECQQDSIYDSEVALIPSRPTLMVDNTVVSPCTICSNSNLAKNKRYCVYYTRGFQCLFSKNSSLRITSEGFSEAVVPSVPELPEALQDPKYDQYSADYGVYVDEKEWEEVE